MGNDDEFRGRVDATLKSIDKKLDEMHTDIKSLFHRTDDLPAVKLQTKAQWGLMAALMAALVAKVILG